MSNSFDYALPDLAGDVASGALGVFFGVIALLILVVACTQLGANTWKRLPEKWDRILTPVLMALALVICTGYLVDGSYNPFLYFRF